MSELAFLGPWGLLGPTLVGALFATLSWGRLIFPCAPQRTQVLGGATFVLAFSVALLQVLLYLNLIHFWVLVAMFGLVVLLPVALMRERTWLPLPRRFEKGQISWSLLPIVLIGGGSLVLCLLAAFWLPVWHWDSLGYHLPFVNFVLQGGGLCELPVDIPYLSTYPRNVELLFVALRATLPDDRLIDFGQIPLGLIGAATTVGIARELGARHGNALCAGFLWLSLPAVFLQLPSNYIDLGTAAFFLLASYFLLLAPSKPVLICAGLAIGLFLGSKPSAPPAAALLAAFLLFRGFQARLLPFAALAVLLAGGIGLEAYLTQLIRHGNPVWPAVVSLGPITLPGTISVEELLSSGASAEKVYGSSLSRVFQSWTSLNATPLFDMRKGGLGVAFLLSFIPAVYFAGSRKHWSLIALAAISLVTPDPAVARYILPFPALLLAAAFAVLSSLPDRPKERWLTHGSAAAIALWAVFYAMPGLTGEGPPLGRYAKMSWSERERAVGANGRPSDFVAARQELKPGEVAVYDKAFFLPYLMWRSDLKNRVIRIPDNATVNSATSLLLNEDVRLIAAGNDEVARRAISANPQSFSQLFPCRESCAAYWHH